MMSETKQIDGHVAVTSSYRDAIAVSHLAAFTAHAETVEHRNEVGETVEAARVVQTLCHLPHHHTRAEERAAAGRAVVAASEDAISPVTHLALPL